MKKHRHRKGHRKHRFAKNPRARHRKRRFRRNPILPSSAGGFLNNTLVPAAVGAGGAIAVDYVMNAGMLPAALTSPQAQPFVRIGAALLLGAGIGSFTNSKTGGEVAAGGIIVTIYQLASQFMSGQGIGAPSLSGARRTWYMPPMKGGLHQRMGYFPHRPNRMGFVRKPGMRLYSAQINKLRPTRMGYIGPAPTMGGMGRYAMGRYTGR